MTKEYHGEYRALMRDAVTGEERWTDEMGEFKNDGGTVYWWSEGNMGCGCNRQSQWHYADPNYDETEWVETDCDDSNSVHPRLGLLHGDCEARRFRVPYLQLRDGSTVGIDGDD